MTALSLPHSRPAPRRFLFIGGAIALLVLAIATGRVLFAQVDGDRGIAPVSASGDIDVGGIDVDATGKNAQKARENGWKLALRKGWEKLGGPKMSDSQLEAMVAAVSIDHESIGPNRYIARLGVVFDRTRAAQFVGGSGPRARSAPMLIIPVLYSGGAETVFEMRNPWQRAWAEYRTGASRIDYVRPSGSGGESLLITGGQTGRRSRIWWRNILDQFGASDVLMPVAKLRRQWPGGPVEGEFTARYGPDNRFIETFALRAANDAALPAMLERAVQRLDGIYARALASGLLQPDPTLTIERGEIDPAVAALIEGGQQADRAAAATAAADAAAADAADPARGAAGAGPGTPPPAASDGAAPIGITSYTIQFATPDAAAVDAGLGAVRGAAGVRGANTSSIAIGGTSVMQVSFGGSADDLAAALRARGFTVSQSGNSLSIRR